MKTFGVSKSIVNRALKKYRNGGANAFFQGKKGGRRGTLLTDEKLQQAQKLLDDGLTRRQTSEELEIKNDTLRKAINAGRLVEGQAIVKNNNDDRVRINHHAILQIHMPPVGWVAHVRAP